jgi:hypothetical protein
MALHHEGLIDILAAFEAHHVFENTLPQISDAIDELHYS